MSHPHRPLPGLVDTARPENLIHPGRSHPDLLYDLAPDLMIYEEAS
jgi:hypothetical protein